MTFAGSSISSAASSELTSSVGMVEDVTDCMALFDNPSTGMFAASGREDGAEEVIRHCVANISASERGSSKTRSSFSSAPDMNCVLLITEMQFKSYPWICGLEYSCQERVSSLVELVVDVVEVEASRCHCAQSRVV